jgi:hypothetical protein
MRRPLSEMVLFSPHDAAFPITVSSRSHNQAR